MAFNNRLSAVSRETSVYGGDFDDDDDDFEETTIQWSNLIFLPFHPIFKLIILFVVLVKTIMGPVISVFAIVYCSDVMDHNTFLLFIKYCYMYFCDPLYLIDTFLYIVHRQVTEKAVRREHLPKSVLLILLDFAAVIPFYKLATDNECTINHYARRMWPNVLGFTEFLLIYRVVDYFSLTTTHSFWKLLIGFMILLIIMTNCMTCLWVLMTRHGLCELCSNKTFFYDWRINSVDKVRQQIKDLPKVERLKILKVLIYINSMVFIFSYISNKRCDDVLPYTVREFAYVCILCIFGYLIVKLIMMPKVFAESILTLRRISAGYPHVKKLVEETKRRNISPQAHLNVQEFFEVVWQKRGGITNVPEVISDLPRYLRIEIRQDLGWPMFYHSPILRKRSISFKRYLCDCVVQDFILPGEKFFAGPHSHSSLYYLKSGIVQILSVDEGLTPVLSVGSGTIFGDASFYLPPFHRKVNMKCLTYCDVLVLTRRDYIKALHKYPEDRRQVMKLTKERLKHAKALYKCKQNIEDIDRAEDEGISWLKRRWWEISDYLRRWNRKGKKDHSKCELPPEESNFHCAKYIGQLVLCTDHQLQTKSLFTNVSFPWILAPHSTFTNIWHKIVLITVSLVMIVYPPNITKPVIPDWFKIFQVWTDIIYIADIGISLLTAVSQRESSLSNFASVMFARSKTLNFNLDLISTLWIEYIFGTIIHKKFFYLAQFNRLIKGYMLFSETAIHLDVKRTPLIRVFLQIILIRATYWYITPYITYAIDYHVPDMTTESYFGTLFCKKRNYKGQCDPSTENVLHIPFSLIVEDLYMTGPYPLHMYDTVTYMIFTVFSYLISVYCDTSYVSSLYLKYREVTNYQNFVSNLKNYYRNIKIHKDLLKRLDKYLMCHWKYYKGVEIMHPHILNNEPYDIYWKVQGEVAEKIISESKVFEGADPALIRELAYASKFLMIPKKSTIFLFGVQCPNVTWIGQGHVKCEYHDDEGALLKEFYGPGHNMLSVFSVFVSKPSLRTYTACTDCEIIFIKSQEFFKIIRKYSDEWSIISNAISEFEPMYEAMFYNYVKKHRDYQNKLIERVFHARKSTIISRSSINLGPIPTSASQRDFWTSPKSNFLKVWLPLRTITIILGIVCESFKEGAGVLWGRPLVLVVSFCDCIAWTDIVLKLFLAFYDERGVLVYDKKKCIINYVTRGFFLDVVGAIPWIKVVCTFLPEEKASLLPRYLFYMHKFAHVYLIWGYFDYLSDRPSLSYTYIQILKWLLIALLTMLLFSAYLMSYCVMYKFGKYYELIDVQVLDTCWIPDIYLLDNMTMEEKLYLIYAESLDLAQCGLLGEPFGNFRINRETIYIGLVTKILMIYLWGVTGYSVTMLILSSRGNTIFQHGVSQLKNFLKSERINKELIEKASAHFTYWWKRTKGVNIHHLTSDRIGMVLRQDLNYFFYRRTYLALDTLLRGGEQMQRQLASASTQIFVMPDEEVIRQMDLNSWVYVVHKGKIIISENGEELNSLTMGSIFGQLSGTEARPARISAKAEGYTDLLQLNIIQFQDIINDNVRNTIDNNPQSQNDYIAIKKIFTDNAYRSIKYLLRGRKTMLLPWMRKPIEARKGNSYSRWLYVVWLIQPFVTAMITLALKTVHPNILPGLYWSLGALDFIQFIHLVLSFFSMELVIVDKKCIQRKLLHRRLKRFDFYIDVFTIAIPPLTFLNGNINYQLVRLLRLKYLLNFHRNFCRSFKSKVAPALTKIVVLVLLMHASTCIWITMACRSKESLQHIRLSPRPENIMEKIDYTEWTLPKQREGGMSSDIPKHRSNYGCYKLHRFYNSSDYFVVPVRWRDDYIIAFTYVIFLYTHTEVEVVKPFTTEQIYFKIIITLVIYLVNMWVMSETISFVTTYYRELYQYDYNVNNLLTYLWHSKLSPALLRSVKEYTKQLWRRQSGAWIPELAQTAPVCLREDMFCSLYMHHLEAPPMLRDLPYYFRRQLATRLRRIVLFPGKCIVQEGDVFPCIYFIHEGEVEKYYFDKSGDIKFLSLLGTNGYFGSMAGLFPNFAFQFSYYTRTVVDLVFLRLNDWQDLLDGYPEIKSNLYITATKFKDTYVSRH